MKYAIIGSGQIGIALARAFARKNIEGAIANSCGPETLAFLKEELGPHVAPQSLQDAYKSEMVFLAVPFPMNRLPFYGAVIVLGHCGVVLWHLLILARLHSALGNDQILLIASLVNLIPVTAAILLWTRCHKIAGWLLLVSLGIGLLIGTYEHFLSPSPDNVFRMTAGHWVLQFRITAVLLVAIEAVGCWIGVKASREETSGAHPVVA